MPNDPTKNSKVFLNSAIPYSQQFLWRLGGASVRGIRFCSFDEYEEGRHVFSWICPKIGRQVCPIVPHIPGIQACEPNGRAVVELSHLSHEAQIFRELASTVKKWFESCSNTHKWTAGAWRNVLPPSYKEMRISSGILI